MDKRLNMTTQEMKSLEEKHISYGRPTLLFNDDVCILHHNDFVSGFSHRLRLPLWTAFNLTRQQVSTNGSSYAYIREYCSLL